MQVIEPRRNEYLQVVPDMSMTAIERKQHKLNFESSPDEVTGDDAEHRAMYCKSFGRSLFAGVSRMMCV